MSVQFAVSTNYFLLTANTAPVSPTVYWVRTLQLTENHKKQITTGLVLSDIHINAAQTLLSRQFPELSGFQLTNYSQRYDKFQLASNNSIQIHHTDAFHWAVSTSIRRPKSCRARILDSMSGDLSSSMQCQLAKIYGVTGKSDTMRVEISPVQQQAGSTDCGLFAIAFATDLAFGMDPVKISYQQSAMREHFVKCLENEKMEQFPRSKRSAHINIRRVATIPVYCTCKMPESLDNMVECERCFQ